MIDKSKNKLEAYNPTLPTTVSLPNVKVLNVLDSLLKNGEEEQTLNVGGNAEVKCSVFYLDINLFDQLEQGTMTMCTPHRLPKINEGLFADLPQDMSFTEYDRAVYSAIVSLSLAGNEVMTPSTIFRVLAGTRNVTVTEEQLKQVRQSVAKMSLIRTFVDYTQEAKQRGISTDNENVDSYKIDAWLISPSYIEVLIGGKEGRAYDIPLPPLYKYASTLKQVIAISSKLLTVGGSDTPERIAVRLYMLRRILANSGKMQDTMLYSTLYEKAGIPRASIPESRLRKFILKCLDEWLAMNVIASYSINAHPSYSKVRYHSITFTRPEKEVT